MVSNKLRESLNNAFSLNKKVKRAKGTPKNIPGFSTERRFIFTPHAKERMKERGVKTFDATTLKPSKKPTSIFFKSEIPKFSNSRKYKATYVYWTDGIFTFVTISKKAGQYIILTVL